MLTLVSVDNKDINPILAAHIYTVCPVAIPALPSPAKDASEDEFMESLGMLREKNGEFETFEKFLSRTEVSFKLFVRSYKSGNSLTLMFTGHYITYGRHNVSAAIDTHVNGWE
jgi:hypothetical protein